MNFIRKLFSHKPQSKTKTLTITKFTPSTHFRYQVPEPTRSLLWLTNENPDKAMSPLAINISINFIDHGVETNINEDEGNILAEPSLIWTKLQVKPNNNLETKPMYYPSYYGLNPEHRYQYLMWLQDVAKPTNLSYVFLYYYGLERHLLIGNYVQARDEILMLIKHHDHDKFRFYVIAPLIAASLFKKRYDIFEKAPFLLREVTNEALIIRVKQDIPLTPTDVIKLASPVQFSNKRYITKYPKEFETKLKQVMSSFEKENGPLWNSIEIGDLEKEKRNIFCNPSIPDNFSEINIPQLLNNEKFQSLIRGFLNEAHNLIKQEKIRKKNGKK